MERKTSIISPQTAESGKQGVSEQLLVTIVIYGVSLRILFTRWNWNFSDHKLDIWVFEHERLVVYSHEKSFPSDFIEYI